jgi:hypothetical protein
MKRRVHIRINKRRNWKFLLFIIIIGAMMWDCLRGNGLVRGMWSVPRWYTVKMEQRWKDKVRGPRAPICPPWIPHGLTWTWARSSALRNRRLTAWACSFLYFNLPLWREDKKIWTVSVWHEVQCIPFKTQSDNNPVRLHKNVTKAGPFPLRDSRSLHREYRVNSILVARPPLTSFAPKLCTCEHDVSTSRKCVHSRTLLSIEIVFCSLWII